MLDRNPATLSADQAATIRNAYAGLLLPEERVQLFRATERIFPTRLIARGPRVRPLRAAPTSLDALWIVSNGSTYDYYDYISRNRVAGLLVLKAGCVEVELYELGIGPTTRWVSMSVAKSISTTLAGAAVQDGFISGVDAPLIDYLPELAGSSYDGVTIRELLQMTSGVRWDNTHTDPASDRRHMLELQIKQQPASILSYVASRPRAHLERIDCLFAPQTRDVSLGLLAHASVRSAPRARSSRCSTACRTRRSSTTTSRPASRSSTSSTTS
jgi:CubicO group peptidase (beta-lactamase class C family)